jgi:hypothetical protein
LGSKELVARRVQVDAGTDASRPQRFSLSMQLPKEGTMSRLRASLLVVATLVLGACSESKAPTDPAAAPPDAARQQAPAASSSEGVVAGIKKGAGLALEEDLTTQGGPSGEHTVRTCNGPRTECITIYHSGNLVTRVYSQAAAQGPGCSRVYFSVNGGLRAYSNPVCHNRGDQLYANWYPRRRFAFGSLFKSDWRGSRWSPPGFATQWF